MLISWRVPKTIQWIVKLFLIYLCIFTAFRVATVICFFAPYTYGRLPAMLNFSTGYKNILAACQTAGIKMVLTSHKFIETANLYTVIEKLVANNINSSGILLYTIGLGKNISEGFLKTITANDSRYFFAPNKGTLDSIYNHISSSICIKKPNVINVIYRSI